MIVRYRRRYRRNGPYWEFDWAMNPSLVLYHLRYYPEWEKVYPAKYQNSHTKQWYLCYKIENDLLAIITKACKEKFDEKPAK